MSMIKTVIFDADGVLVNGERFSVIMARELETNPVMEKEFFTGPFQECLVGRADLKESVEPYLRDFGCNVFQGYFFERPCSVEIFENSLNSHLLNTPPILPSVMQATESVLH